MIIVNADDWGRSARETDAAAECFEGGRITSVTAMVFMRDSIRAAEMANKLGIDVGLHLNLSQPFDGEMPNESGLLLQHHDRAVRFLRSTKYSSLVYNPFLRPAFRYLYEAQVAEFHRLYGRPPSHVDGHHHMHLCTNMLADAIIPRATRVRRGFSYGPGEKGLANRGYRAIVDRVLKRRYRVTDFLFSLSENLDGRRIRRVADLCGQRSVELMAHPANPKESAFLMSDEFLAALSSVEKSTYLSI